MIKAKRKCAESMNSQQKILNCTFHLFNCEWKVYYIVFIPDIQYFIYTLYSKCIDLYLKTAFKCYAEYEIQNDKSIV